MTFMTKAQRMSEQAKTGLSDICPECGLATDGQSCPFTRCPKREPELLVRDMLDEDVDLFGDCLHAFHEALTKPHDIPNLQAAVDALASAAAPFGRLRQQLNEAVAKEAVASTMRRRLRERHEQEAPLYDRLRGDGER